MMLTNKEAIKWVEYVANESSMTFDDDSDETRLIREKAYANIKQALIMAIEALKQTAWIPVGERLPDDDGEYLVCYENGYREDHSLPEIGIQSFDVNCDGFGEWIDYYHPETLGFVDSDWSEIKVKAWMPLPEPYKGGDNND